MSASKKPAKQKGRVTFKDLKAKTNPKGGGTITISDQFKTVSKIIVPSTPISNKIGSTTATDDWASPGS